MKRFQAFIIVAILGCGTLWSAGYPTVWTVTNSTNSKVYFICESANLSPGAIIPTEKLDLNPNMSQAYTWYSFYNDGRGLNPSEWLCEAGDETGHRGQGGFRTGWGEAVNLRIDEDNGTYRITKI